MMEIFHNTYAIAESSFSILICYGKIAIVSICPDDLFLEICPRNTLSIPPETLLAQYPYLSPRLLNTIASDNLTNNTEALLLKYHYLNNKHFKILEERAHILNVIHGMSRFEQIVTFGGVAVSLAFAYYFGK
jgi:hypothetical protein